MTTGYVLREPRGIEGREGTVGGPQEAVSIAVFVEVESRDGPRRVDASG